MGLAHRITALLCKNKAKVNPLKFLLRVAEGEKNATSVLAWINLLCNKNWAIL